jgi:hypothetical protein
MIKLKNGHDVPFNEDFDLFFQDLLESIVRESKRAAESSEGGAETRDRNELFLKELMDNCIYVTHQLFDMGKDREEFSRFMVTGFIFNSIVTCLASLDKEPDAGDDPAGIPPVH